MEHQSLDTKKKTSNANAHAHHSSPIEERENSLSGKAESREPFTEPAGFFPHPFINISAPVQKKEEKEGNLPNDIQMKMEDAFETDFSDVTVHQDSAAARDLQAVAYTQENEIHFAPGHNPFSSFGQEVLGHELSHVVQQKSGIVQTTHQESGFNVNADEKLEKQADTEGKKAANGQKVNSGKPLISNPVSNSVQKKSQPIQLWRDLPGQARVERTVAPDTDAAWRAVENAIGQVVGGFTGSVINELRALLIGQISEQLSGGLGTITINNFKTYGGINFTWRGDIRFKIEGEQEIAGGGTSTSTIGSGGTTTTGSSTADAQTGGSTGGATVSNTPAGATGGTGGNATAGVNSSQTNTQGNSSSTARNATSSSVVSQELKRYSAQIGCFVHLSADTSFGDSGWDYVNPAAWVSGASGAIGTAINGNGDASTKCGSVIYYEGNGITPAR